MGLSGVDSEILELPRPFYLAPTSPPNMVPKTPFSMGPNKRGKIPPRCTNIFFFWRMGIFFWTIWRRTWRCLPKHCFWCLDKGIVPFKTFKQHSHTVSMTSLEAVWMSFFRRGGEALDRTDNMSPCLAKRGGSPFLFFPWGFLEGDIFESSGAPKNTDTPTWSQAFFILERVATDCLYVVSVWGQAWHVVQGYVTD